MKQKFISFGKEMTKNKSLYLMFLPAAVLAPILSTGMKTRTCGSSS